MLPTWISLHTDIDFYSDLQILQRCSQYLSVVTFWKGRLENCVVSLYKVHSTNNSV